MAVTCLHTRRLLLRRAWLLPAGTLVPQWLRAQSASGSASALATKVPAMVRLREAIADEMQPFRKGASARIDAVMEQLVSVGAELAAAPPARLQALTWALRLYLTESRRQSYAKHLRSQHVDGSVTSFGTGNLKCNKLVADAYAAGAGCGLSVGTNWNGEGTGTGWPAMKQGDDAWPPQANDLANSGKNLRSLTNARELRAPGDDKATPELGDIIAFPSREGSGHVGLYLGKDLIVSAKESGIEIHPLEYEQSLHDNTARIRKFNGSGK